MSNLHYELLLTKAFLKQEKEKLSRHSNKHSNKQSNKQSFMNCLKGNHFLRQEKYYKSKIVSRLVLLTKKEQVPIVQQILEKEVDTWTQRLDHLYSSHEFEFE